MADSDSGSKRAERNLGLAKAALSAVPVVGGPASELLDLVIRPRIEERRTEWLNSIAEGLAKLEETR